MLVITDLDGTLYSWVDFIVPSLEAMVASVCETTREPRIRVVQALKQVYERYGSNEYPFALQESALFLPYASDFESFDRLVIDPAREAFSSRRRRYLRLFPTVKETLQALKARGVRVVALTDAPRNPAEARIRQLDLGQYVEALYCMPGFQFPTTGVSAAIRGREEAGHYRAPIPVVELPRELEKPDSRGYLRICSDQGVKPEDTIFIGDNLKKDMKVARNVGALGVWAAYGTYVSAEYRDRLDVISAHSVTRRHVSDPASDEPLPEPDETVAEFRGLLEVLDRRYSASERDTARAV